MSKFPSHLITKSIKNEILDDASKLAAVTLPWDIHPAEAAEPQSTDLMLEIRFSPEREPGNWLRVSFINRSETSISNYAYRIGYGGACCGLPITRAVLAHSISPRIFPPFEAMIRSGLRQKKVEQWVLGVAHLAQAHNRFDSVLAQKLADNQMDWPPF